MEAVLESDNLEVRREGLPLIAGLGAAAFALGPLTLDLSMPAMGAIQTGLHTSITALKATLTAYLVGGAVCFALYGFVADRFARRTSMFWAVGIYCAGSLLGALTPNVDGLLWARAMQGFGGCMLLIAARAIISDALDERGAAKAFSVAITGLAVASVLSPLIGASLLELFGWRWLFIFMALAGAASSSLILLVAEPPLARDRDVSLLGDALNYFSLLRSGSFMCFALASGLWFGISLTYAVTAPFIYSGQYGTTPGTTALLLSLVAVGPIAAAQLNVLLLRRWRPEALLRIGLALVVALGLLLLLSASFLNNLAIMVACLFMTIAIGKGLVYSNSLATSLALAPGRRGAASSLQGLLQSLLGAAGSAITGAFALRGIAPLAIIIIAFGAMGLLSALVGGRLARKPHASDPE